MLARLFAFLILATTSASASRLIDVTPVTNSIIMLHLIDGTVRHESLGNGLDGQVTLEPLDTTKAADPASFSISSPDDPHYKTVQIPAAVGRKTKGREFVKAQDGTFPYLPEHWIFLRFPQPMQLGAHYRLTLADGLGSAPRELSWTYLDNQARSEAVHVNQVGYRPAATKFAYVSMWMGDLGPLSLDAFDGAPFQVRLAKTGGEVFHGKLQLRRHREAGPESASNLNPGEPTPYANADVWECDFSGLTTPGRYLVSVDGIGCSFPFNIGEDVYHDATTTVLRALYHQRCHTALDAKFTDRPRAACHIAPQTKFLQTTVRSMDKIYGDGKQNDAVTTTGEERTVTFGWHDAGDWDHERWHSEVVETLLQAYELTPARWTDGASHIPESGNGIPDIVDEAMWGANLYKQLQRPDGGTSSGTFADWWPRDGQTSTTDTMTYYVYSPDPIATYRWAAIGARLSTILAKLGKPALAEEYLKSALLAWNWAGHNLQPGDEPKVRDDRCQAAAALYQATGEAPYLAAFKNDFHIKIGDALMIYDKFDLRWAAWIYAFCDRPDRDREFQKTVVQLCLNYANGEYVDTADKRAFRVGYNWWRGLSYGAGSNPDGLPLAVAHALTKDPKYLNVLAHNCDLTLGGNPMNMSWVTGLGSRSPREILRIEDWYGPWTKRDEPMNPLPGILVFGPYAFAGDPDPQKGSGPWDVKFNQATLYPHGSKWPGYELYLEDRLNAATTEFTVYNLATAVASFGYE